MTRETRRFFVPDDTPIHAEPDEKSASRSLGRDELLSLIQDQDVAGVAWRWVHIRSSSQFGYNYIKASVPIFPAQYRIRKDRLGAYFAFSLAASLILSSFRVDFPASLWLAFGVFVFLSVCSMALSSYSKLFGFVEWRRPDEAFPAFDLRRFLLREGLGMAVLLIVIVAVPLLSQCGAGAVG